MSMDNGKNDRRSLLMFIASMLIFGTIGIFRRQIPLPSALIACVRGLLGGGLLLIVMWAKRGRSAVRERLPARLVGNYVLTGAIMGVNWILLFEAYEHTTVAIATLCYYMQPTIVVLLSPFVFREKLTGKKGICAAVAIAGMVLVSGVADGGAQPAGNVRGILLGLGAAVCYSAVVIMNKRISGTDVWQKTVIQLLSAGGVMIPYLLLTGVGSVGSLEMKTIGLLLIVGIVHTGIAYMLYFGSMDGLKAQSIAILSYIDPVSALLFSALWLREPLSLAGIIGAVMIIGSAIVSEMERKE